MARNLGDPDDIPESKSGSQIDPVDTSTRKGDDTIDLVNDVDHETRNKSAAEISEAQAKQRTAEMKSKMRGLARQIFNESLKTFIGATEHKKDESTFKIELVGGRQMTVCGAFDNAQSLQKIYVFETGQTVLLEY